MCRNFKENNTRQSSIKNNFETLSQCFDNVHDMTTSSLGKKILNDPPFPPKSIMLRVLSVYIAATYRTNAGLYNGNAPADTFSSPFLLQGGENEKTREDFPPPSS